MTPKAYIHAGLHKTATTFLQTALKDSSRELAAKGFYYGQWGMGPGQANLAAKVVAQGKDRKNETGILDKYAKDGFSSDDSIENIVFSSEVLIDAEIEILEKELALLAKDCEVNIVLTIRPFRKMISSLFQERLKWGHPMKFSRKDDWLNLLTSNDLSLGYLTRLIKIAEKGGYRMHCINVDDQQTCMPHEKLCKILNLDPSVIKAPQDSVNSSYPALNQLVLELINNLPACEEISLEVPFMVRQSLANLLSNGKLPDSSPVQNNDLIPSRRVLMEIAKNAILPPCELDDLFADLENGRDQLILYASRTTIGTYL
ncbi:hypothetical protein [Cyanobium sp. NS01]|uniref:hypothetical protein n=1 Tax=Cyanobium sp. NS01 TaxID=261284 RepID=UPI00164641C9|nr:hypothetical protein [Cyanobium sp. NS01]QNI71231.1 hypothetical protein CyaNS01_02107 [Cyanobium sp. NS01]